MHTEGTMDRFVVLVAAAVVRAFVAAAVDVVVTIAFTAVMAFVVTDSVDS